MFWNLANQNFALGFIIKLWSVVKTKYNLENCCNQQLTRVSKLIAMIWIWDLTKNEHLWAGKMPPDNSWSASLLVCILLNYKIVEGIWHNLVWSKANINERFKSKYSLFLTKNSTLKEKIWNYNFTILSIATYKYSWREIFIKVVCSLSWPSLRGLDCVWVMVRQCWPGAGAATFIVLLSMQWSRGRHLCPMKRPSFVITFLNYYNTSFASQCRLANWYNVNYAFKRKV